MRQTVVAERFGLSQQAVSGIVRPNQNITIETLRQYLNALKYTVEITVREPENGVIVDTVRLDPVASP